MISPNANRGDLDMLITIDRLQFIDDQLMCFEFIDIGDSDLGRINKGVNHFFIKDKIELLKKLFPNAFYLIQYDLQTEEFYIKYDDQAEPLNGKSKPYNLKSFKEWFHDINNRSNFTATTKSSKPLGSMANHTVDSYVQEILQYIYEGDTNYPKIDFSADDNGLGLVKMALKGNNTYGFDFDLFETSNHVVIEFLKKDFKYITNLTAHPNRYPRNYQKFLSLWRAATAVGKNNVPNLLLINYSDEQDKPISVIKVLDFNLEASITQIGIISDIGYKFNDYEDIVNWLRELNYKPEEALRNLEGKPKEIRNAQFWEEFPANKHKIGTNYK